MRRGLWTPWILVPGCSGIFVAGAFAPFLVPAKIRARLFGTLFIYPLFSLFILLSVIFLWPLQKYGIYFYSFLALVGLVRGLSRLRRISVFQLGFLLVLTSLVSVYLFLFINPANYANVFAPELALLGRLRKDTYYATVIAHMIQNYGVSSTGLDGLVRFHYHTGSHFWFAMLGRLTGQAPLFSYPTGLFLVLIPAQFYALTLSGICVGSKTGFWIAVRRGEGWEKNSDEF